MKSFGQYFWWASIVLTLIVLTVIWTRTCMEAESDCVTWDWRPYPARPAVGAMLIITAFPASSLGCQSFEA